MGHAEVISLAEVRASKQWHALHQQLHERFDQWIDTLEEQLDDLPTTLSEVSQSVWKLRQCLTGGITEVMVNYAHARERQRQQITCNRCNRVLKVRDHVCRTVETLVGPLELERPYFYCRSCRQGSYPLDEVLALSPGCKQLDVQQAALELATEVPYDEAQRLFGALTGIAMGSERMHTVTTHVAEALMVLDVAPSREQIEQCIAELSSGRFRPPVLVLGIDGAYVPTRPTRARERRQGVRRHRSKRARWRGEWCEAKGFRFYLLDGDRIVQVMSCWHQVQDEAQLGEALKQIKEAALIPQDKVRLCVVCDGASWIWKHVQGLFPKARQVLDYYHCRQYLHRVAKAQYGSSLQAMQWVEATMMRLYLGKAGSVLGGLKRMQARSEEAAKALSNCWDYLHEHRGRTAYRKLRRGGYALGSGGIESSNKFICHVRLKRPEAWWYESNSNGMLALRCAKYNGTFDQVFGRYQQRLWETAE